MDLPVNSTVDKGGAPIGNDNAKKGKLFYDQLRKVLVQNDSLKLRLVSEKLVDAAIEGEPWAVKEIMDRMDGKAVAIQEIQGPDGTQLKAGFVLTFEEPNGNNSGS
jgi:glycerol-3-phosphate cytidylyltransferase-like family protein